MKNNKRYQNGFSLIELLVVVAIILIIAAIAIPNLLQARVAANEASAVAALRTINNAQITYAYTYETVGYASSLTVLGGTSCSPATETSACLIDMQLASGSKGGYTFAATGIGDSPIGFYLVTAMPVGNNGNRSFCTTESNSLFFDPTGAAIADHDSCQALSPLQ